MFLSRVVLIGMGTSLGTAGLLGAEAGPLTLAQAQRLALTHNTDVRLAAAQAGAALALMRSAREFPNPALALSTAKIATDGSGNRTALGNGLFDRSYDSTVALSQLLELGKRGPRQASAQAGLRAAEAQQEDVRRLTVLAVSQAYVSAVEADEERRVLAASADSLRREAELAVVRFAAGDLAANDREQIALAARRLDLDAVGARRAAQAAVIVVETLLGQTEPDGRTVLADALEDLPLAPAADGDAWPGGARPDVAAAEAAVAKAEADLALQRRAVWPDLVLSAQYERNPPDQPNTAGLGLTLPLPLWNRNGGGIRSARAARDAAQAQLDKVRLQAVAELANARLAYQEAAERAAAYRDGLRPQSAAVVKTVAYAYEHGGASLLDLLATERNDHEVRLAAARARADALNASFALAAALNRSAP